MIQISISTVLCKTNLGSDYSVQLLSWYPGPFHACGDDIVISSMVILFILNFLKFFNYLLLLTTCFDENQNTLVVFLFIYFDTFTIWLNDTNTMFSCVPRFWNLCILFDRWKPSMHRRWIHSCHWWGSRSTTTVWLTAWWTTYSIRPSTAGPSTRSRHPLKAADALSSSDRAPKLGSSQTQPVLSFLSSLLFVWYFVNNKFVTAF